MVYENALNIYADGSSYSHPRRGGIGIRYVTIDDAGNEVVQNEEILGYEGATNNEMELLACIKALEGAIKHPNFATVDRIYVFTDSMYITNNLVRAKFEWLDANGIIVTADQSRTRNSGSASGSSSARFKSVLNLNG
jgi:ribonuclease HI